MAPEPAAVALAWMSSPGQSIVAEETQAVDGVIVTADVSTSVPFVCLATTWNVPVGRSVESLLRSTTTLVLAAALVAVVVAVAVTRQVAVLAGVIPILLGLVSATWRRFTTTFGFRVATSPDGIRLHHGLLTTRSQTVPPGRVQAVRVSQPLMWRGRDWWRRSGHC